ncbi:flagellar filament capping protein FliD [Nitrosophilus kaiyonis]|uniref:flagellar filament capping protein FliD n=1 Tax=Nitrosophilus kaiyonis TaxID=2930200 RepID=UPI0024924175|nr:flagellar filament capping protein FliD [Nitrosophilus kaiyonis]
MAGEIYLSNLSGQFDYQGILQKFQELKTKQLSLLQQKEDEISQKKSAFKTFGNMINDFKKNLDSLLNDKIFYDKDVSVSNENILSASVIDSQKLSETSIQLTTKQLAKNDVWLSQSGVSNKDSDAVATSDGTLQIKYAEEEIANIDYTNSDTLQEIANKINSSQDKVIASIFYDGNNYRLLLSGKDTGKDNIIELNETGSGDLLDSLQIGSNYSDSHVQNSQNAIINIYGEDVESSTNSFKEVIQGLNIEIKSISNDPVDINVKENNSQIEEKLQNLITNYNSIVDYIKEQTSENAPLSGEFSMQQIRSGIFRNLNPLLEAGILEVDHTNGHISLKNEKLNDYFENDKDSLKTKIDELETGLENYVDFVLDVEGPIKSKDKSYSRQINSIEERIESTAKRVEAEIENLKKQFVYLDRFLAQMNDIRSRLSALLPKQNQTNTQ